jgi:hypothetical protein
MLIGVVAALAAGIAAGVMVTGASGSNAAAMSPKGTTTSTGPLPSTPPTTVTPPTTRPKHCSHRHKKKSKRRCKPHDRRGYLTGGL